MEKLIRVSKISVLTIFLILFLSCKSTFHVNRINYISLASVLEKDFCTVIIDGKTQIESKEIITDRSLGIDLDNDLSYKSSSQELQISIAFRGNIMPESNFEKERVVKLDTSINLRHGRYILITGRINNIEILQSKRSIVVD